MITVSERAAQRIAQLKTDEAETRPNAFLRVAVAKGGCSGMSYKLDFSTELKEEDKVFDQHGVKLVIDRTSYLYLIGMELDFEGGLNGKGFIFSNPNASRTCGCGSSFGV